MVIFCANLEKQTQQRNNGRVLLRTIYILQYDNIPYFVSVWSVDAEGMSWLTNGVATLEQGH